MSILIKNCLPLQINVQVKTSSLKLENKLLQKYCYNYNKE